jgi:RNA methyltransferase, TrmH family
MEVLLSEKNPLLKQVRRAVQKGSLTDDGFAVAEGFHLLEEALKSQTEIGTVIVSQSVRGAIQSHVNGLKLRVVTVRDADFASLTSTETPQGVIALVRPPAWTLDQVLRGRVPLIAVLDGIQDPGNAGAILRAAEAFGATGAAFLKGTVSPHNPKCMRASAGSVFRLPIAASLDESLLLAALEKKRSVLYAAMPRADILVSGANFKMSCAIVIGSEGRGVSLNLAEHAIALRIPTSGVESLNAAVAAGILFYEARRQRTP